MGYPNTCQPRSRHPFLPIYHVIGNVTTDADGEMTNLEAINDVSSVIQYKGLYHVFHREFLRRSKLLHSELNTNKHKQNVAKTIGTTS